MQYEQQALIFSACLRFPLNEIHTGQNTAENADFKTDDHQHRCGVAPRPASRWSRKAPS